jgi:hypothetical protein
MELDVKELGRRMVYGMVGRVKGGSGVGKDERHYYQLLYSCKYN